MAGELVIEEFANADATPQGAQMKIEIKPTTMDIEGKGQVVRIKSGGMIVLLFLSALLVVCSSSFIKFRHRTPSPANHQVSGKS